MELKKALRLVKLHECLSDGFLLWVNKREMCLLKDCVSVQLFLCNNESLCFCVYTGTFSPWHFCCSVLHCCPQKETNNTFDFLKMCLFFFLLTVCSFFFWTAFPFISPSFFIFLPLTLTFNSFCSLLLQHFHIFLFLSFPLPFHRFPSISLCILSARTMRLCLVAAVAAAESRENSFSRSRSSSVSSIDRDTKEAVTTLQFGESYGRKSDALPTPCLWVGTSLGVVLLIPMSIPVDQEERMEEPVTIGPSGKHQQNWISLQSDSWPKHCFS